MAELQAIIQKFMKALDGEDYDTLLGMFADDAQGVDELSRRWMRGHDAMSTYFREFGPDLSDIHSELSDISESVWGDTGLATCWMEQSYKFQGEQQHFSGPMSLLFRRDGANWKVALVHAVPLPQGTTPA